MMDIILLIPIAITFFVANAEATDIGVNYGMLGNDLPTPEAVVSLLKSRNIGSLRLFDPNPGALGALHGSGISVILGTFNQDLPRLARSSSSYADDWVATNVVPHAGYVRFRYITAGNEVVPGDLATYVVPAMRNLDAALRAARLPIPVTTVVSTQVLGVSYPPSQGAFSSSVEEVMTAVVSFLKVSRAPLLVNAYPYFAYAGGADSIRLDYALLASRSVAVRDGPYSYTNLFDSILDAVHSALEKASAPDVEVVVAETGWPSGGGGAATVRNAATYNNNVVRRVQDTAGTPRRPGKRIETYLFAIFNENAKAYGVEQNFGLYHPNMTEVYHLYL